MATGTIYFFYNTSIGPSQITQGTFAVGPPAPPPRRGQVAFITNGTSPNSGGTGVPGPWLLTNPNLNPLSVP